MQQAGSYGGGYVAPPPQGYATSPPSYPMGEFDAYGAPLGHAYGQQPQEPAYLPAESGYPAPEPSAYNPNSAYAPSQASYAAAEPSYGAAAPSYGPAAPSYDYYSCSAPPSATSPAQAQSYPTPSYSYNDGGYAGLQSYGSGGSQAVAAAFAAPAQGYQQAGYDQGGYNRVGYEQAGYGSQAGVAEARGYERDGGAAHGNSSSGAYDDGRHAEVYAYDGGQAGEPYGARGTGGSAWSSSGTAESGGGFGGSGGGSKVARAVPKADSDSTGGGIQKYRVKMLPDASSSTSKDVICQIGLDGVRMLDPSTSRTLRIYPLETITRWEVYEPAIFTFWAKSAVDVEQRCIRLQSSSYTTSAILDTITAACVQLCEMVGKDGPEKSSGGGAPAPDAGLARKSSIADWVPLRGRMPSEEEKQHWVPDEAATKCSNCYAGFSVISRRHHCRNCGDVFCDRCTKGRTPLMAEEGAQAVRVCDRCLAEVTQRLSNAKDASKVAPVRTHEDLAKKLQEELERNAGRRESGGSKGTSGSSGNKGSGTSVLNCSKCGNISLVAGGNSRCPSCGAGSSSSHVQRGSYGSSATQGSGPRTREVACPTCTVHLQVQVPSSGTETVECGVCQHPFLVSA